MTRLSIVLVKVIQQIIKILQFLSSVTLMGVMVLVVIDVVGRYFFGSPLNGATELTEFGVAVIVFFAFPVVGVMERHVSIDIMDPFFPKKFAYFRNVFTGFLMGSTLITVSYYILLLGARSLKRNEISEYLRIPVYTFFYFIAAMCFLSGLLILLKFIFKLKINDSKSPSMIS